MGFFMLSDWSCPSEHVPVQAVPPSVRATPAAALCTLRHDRPRRLHAAVAANKQAPIGHQ